MCGLAKAQVDGCVCGMCGGVTLRKKNKTARLQVGELLRSEGEHARCSCRQAASSRLSMWMCVLLCVVCVEGGVVLSAEHKSRLGFLRTKRRIAVQTMSVIQLLLSCPDGSIFSLLEFEFLACLHAHKHLQCLPMRPTQSCPSTPH